MLNRGEDGGRERGVALHSNSTEISLRYTYDAFDDCLDFRQHCTSAKCKPTVMSRKCHIFSGAVFANAEHGLRLLYVMWFQNQFLLCPRCYGRMWSVSNGS